MIEVSISEYENISEPGNTFLFKNIIPLEESNDFLEDFQTNIPWNSCSELISRIPGDYKSKLTFNLNVLTRGLGSTFSSYFEAVFDTHIHSIYLVFLRNGFDYQNEIEVSNSYITHLGENREYEIFYNYMKSDEIREYITLYHGDTVYIKGSAVARIPNNYSRSSSLSLFIEGEDVLYTKDFIKKTIILPNEVEIGIWCDPYEAIDEEFDPEEIARILGVTL